MYLFWEVIQNIDLPLICYRYCCWWWTYR